jgi:hypothetical protein
MIKDYRIVIATTLSNTVTTGYYPTSEVAIQTYCKPDYVDEVLVAEGMSEDDTVSLHSNISSKVKILSKKKWPVDTWTWQNLWDQYDVIYDYCKFAKTGQPTILLYFSADQVFTDYFIEELETELIRFIQNDNIEFMLLPFAKTITYEFLTLPYDPPDHFHIYSAVKFDAKRDYLGVRGMLPHRGENKLLLPNNRLFVPRPLTYNFRTFPISYDMFFFTKENLMAKIIRHDNGIRAESDAPWGSAGATEYIKNHWLKKAIPLLGGKIKLRDHPSEMIEKICTHLDESKFGYSCFDNLSGKFELFVEE